MKNGTKTIVEYAVICALLFVARSLDHIISGWLPINSAAVTLTVAYACMLYKPTFVRSVMVGLLFGVMSLLTSLIFGGGALIYGMANPLISVLPRVIVGVDVIAVFSLVKRLVSGKKGFVIATVAACLTGTVINTATVLSMIWLFQSVVGASLTNAVGLIFSVNVPAELIVPAISVPFIVLGMRKGLKVKDAYSDEQERNADERTEAQEK